MLRLPLIWGWASWAKTWASYDAEINDWPLQKNKVQSLFKDNKNTKRFWVSTFNLMYQKKIDTWDYQLAYLFLLKGYRSLVPQKNLIKNIGFGDDATHTIDSDSEAANRTHYELDFNVKFEVCLTSQKSIDSYFDTYLFTKNSLFTRIKNKLYRQLFKQG